MYMDKRMTQEMFSDNPSNTECAWCTYVVFVVSMLSQQLLERALRPGRARGVVDARCSTFSHSRFHSASEKIRPA